MKRRTFILGGLTAGLGAVAGVTLGTHWIDERRAVPIDGGGPRSRFADRRRFVSKGGVLVVELTASEQWVDLAGRRARLFAFNGQVPGPVMEAQPGDDVRIRFRNDLPDPTNLHFHGLHVPPDGRADNIFLRVPSGESLDYAFRIPPTHPAGFFWVHPHLHGLVAKHVSLGLAAPLFIRGEVDAIPEVAAAPDHLLVLQDFELLDDGRPADPGMQAMMLGREGSLITVTGKHRPQYAVEENGLARLRLLNASSSRFYRLKLEGHPMHVIGTDGGAVETPETLDELLIAPGERRDVLVRGDRAPGVYRLLNLPYDRGSMGMMGGMMGGGRMSGRGGMGASPPESSANEIATLIYRGVATRRASVPQKIGSLPPLPEATIRRSFELGDGMSMRPGAMGMRFTINGREFDAERIDTRVPLGSVEEWEYVNSTSMDHPMHIHTNPFRVVAPDGSAERAWRDVTIVKARSRRRLRIRFEDFPGKTVQHCHILDHEDRGMMATLLMAE